ncbi:fibroin p25 domain-containing protein [Phthorimaea operculella]|nr:fibroin p25 domain-containing protein [Phthorimaea operculella]
MKKINVVITLLFGIVCSATSEYEGYEKVGNPDDTAKIERPCPTYDLNCIRVFFEHHGHCKKTFGPVPEPISRPQSNIYFPRVNLTLSIVDQRISGLNGRIEEFYINRETDRLVIAVEFTNLTQTSDKVYFKSHRPRREPVVTVTSYFSVFDPIIITAVIPKIDNLQLDDAEVTAFITGQTARFAVTPTLVTSTDPQPAMSVATAFTNLSEDMQELFLTDSSYLIATYIQYNICDFGLLLT